MSDEIRKNESEEPEIDLIDLALKLWSKRNFILIFTSVFIVLGVFVALFATKKYTSSSIVVPQVKSRSSSSSISAMAAMAGINLSSGMGNSSDLSPYIYPNILDNINFRKELMYSEISVEGGDEKVSLFEYFTDEKYKKVSAVSVLKKYTLGLPKLIINAIKPEAEDSITGANTNSEVEFYSKKEYGVVNRISGLLQIELNDKDGYITISATMDNAVAAAEICQTTIRLLEKYITIFKLEKVSEEQKYVQERYNEAKENYHNKQQAYARYKDANRTLSSALVAMEEERLSNEYKLSNSLYAELSKRLLEVNLKLKEDTPVLTKVKPPVVPNEDNSNGAVTLILFTFLGFILSSAIVLGVDYLKNVISVKKSEN